MDKGSTPFTSTNSAPLDKRLSRLPFTEEIRGSKPLRSTLYREIVAAVARQAHNLEVGGSIPSLATEWLNKVYMKKLLLFLSITVLLSSCVWMPTRMSIHEKRLWNHQNRVKVYYFKTYPFRHKRIIKGKTYIPYFRPGKY